MIVGTSAQVIDGRARARELRDTLVGDVQQLRVEGIAAGLATVVVGHDFGSVAYERRLRHLAGATGIGYRAERLPHETSKAELVRGIEELNADATVSGILVLRPLPPQIDEAAVFRAIDPRKDIEAVHPENAGLLALGAPRFVPSTAAAVFHLLDTWLDSVGEDRKDFYHRSLIVVVGRSNNVGKPAVSLGYDRQATVQSLDEWADRTTGIGRYTRRADVLIVAAGKPGLIRAEHVGEHTIVLDVGINPRAGSDGRVHMVGDVDQESVASRARAITPVPGGVGPVTAVWLLRNTVAAARGLTNRVGAAPSPSCPNSRLEE